MEASEFRAWLERRGWTYAEAAPHFRVDPSTVWRWQTGKRGVPGPVEVVTELMDANDVLLLNVKVALGETP